MADVNTGNKRTFSNGGEVIIGALTVINVVTAEVAFKYGFEEEMPQYEKNQLAGAPLPGKERMTEFTLNVHAASGVSFAALKAAVLGAKAADDRYKRINTTNGTVFTFSLTIKEPDYLGATTGDQYVYEDCYVNGQPEWKGGGGSGEEFSRFSMDIRSCHAAPKETRYSGA